MQSSPSNVYQARGLGEGVRNQLFSDLVHNMNIPCFVVTFVDGVGGAKVCAGGGAGGGGAAPAEDSEIGDKSY